MTPARSVEVIFKEVDSMCSDVSQLCPGGVLSFPSCCFLVCFFPVSSLPLRTIRERQSNSSQVQYRKYAKLFEEWL